MFKVKRALSKAVIEEKRRFILRSVVVLFVAVVVVVAGDRAVPRKSDKTTRPLGLVT